MSLLSNPRQLGITLALCTASFLGGMALNQYANAKALLPMQGWSCVTTTLNFDEMWECHR